MTSTPIKFSGTGKEFFGIWMSNLFLSIITLGIYSAWAKVRQQKYFYGNTTIHGESLVYHASGLQILVGRMIALLLFSVYIFVSELNLTLNLLSIVGLTLVLPFIINQTLRFRARMTSWHNVHFKWHGTYWQSLQAFVLYPLLGVFSFGLLLPIAVRQLNKYLANTLSLGNIYFSAQFTYRIFYGLFGRTILIFIPAILILYMLISPFFTQILSGDEAVPAQSTDFFLQIYVVGLVAAFFAYLIVRPAYTAWARNIFFNALKLGDVAHFSAHLSARRYSWIIVSNFFILIGTFFLATPWTQIRHYKYLCDKTEVTLDPEQINLRGKEDAENSAIAEEFSLFQDIDIGL